MKTTLISAESFPLLYKGYLMIQHDHGVLNRLETDCPFQTAERPDEVRIAEAELSVLTDEEFATFCIGAADEQEALQEMYQLNEADYIFTEWFGQICERK